MPLALAANVAERACFLKRDHDARAFSEQVFRTLVSTLASGRLKAWTKLSLHFLPARLVIGKQFLSIFVHVVVFSAEQSQASCTCDERMPGLPSPGVRV